MISKTQQAAIDELTRRGNEPWGFSPKILAKGRELRLGVLSNPLSGGNQTGLNTFAEDVKKHPHAIHREARTPAEVRSALAEFANKQVDIVAVNGGDGTIQAVLTALFHSQPFEILPLLALLRSGTDSMIARDVGLPGSRNRALRRLLHWLHGGDGEAVIQRRPVLRVQVAGHQQPLYGMFFGAAGIYQGTLFCRSRLHTLGLRGELAASGLTLALLLLTVVFGRSNQVAPVPMAVVLDGKPEEKRDYVLVLISTLNRLLIGLRPYWGRESGPLHYTAIAARPRHLLRTVPFLARGRRCRCGTEENGYFSHNVHEVRLFLNSGFNFDGELYTPEPRLGPVVVQNGGQASFLRL